jgi:hypothetical protein
MPNRILRETICCSETLARLSAESERLFYRLLTQADDYGRFDARPSVVRSRCFQLGGVTDASIARWIGDLTQVDLIRCYTLDARDYGYFPTWPKYQRIRSPQSKYPDPPPLLDNYPPQLDSECGSRARASGSGSVFGSVFGVDVSNSPQPAARRARTAPRPRATQWPDDFDLTLERAEVAATLRLDAAVEWNKFRDRLEGRHDPQEQDAAWRYWCRRAPEFQRRKTWGN